MTPRKTSKTTEKTPRSTRSQKTKKTISPRQTKPMFRAGTWVTLLMLALLIGAAYYLNQQGENASEESPELDVFSIEESEFLFDKEKTVTSIEVKPADGETVRMERDGEAAWMLILPFKTEAAPGLVEAAASQLMSLSIVDEIEAASDSSIFGVDNPAYVIIVKFDDGMTSTLEIGDATPSNSGYYARVDKAKIVILTLSGIDALTNLAKFPPYLNTPTPTATATLPPTETPVPSAESDSAPEATSTP